MRTVVLKPESSGASWWTSTGEQGAHLGDSFLYAGLYDSQVFVSAVRFDISPMLRGQPILSGSLVLTGLKDDRLASAAEGTWTIDFLVPGAVEELHRTNFQKLYNASPAFTLLPALAAADLAARRPNNLSLDPAVLEWLSQQTANGASGVTVRIVGPRAGASSLFAWDSGSGPATGGMGPEVLLQYASTVATGPTPTARVVVATSTATPANVMTVAARALTATAARAAGTPTPALLLQVTPTPMQQGVVVTATPTPANEATATAYANYATAVAVTTGTYTPIPTYVATPYIIEPTPVADSVLIAAAQVIAATEQARYVGTGTPLPFNAWIATVTPTPPVLTTTPVPANEATVRAWSGYATAVAITTGTYTPMPNRFVTPTPTPLPTATPYPTIAPLILYLDRLAPTPVPPPTVAPGRVMPAEMRGRILFRSDRDRQSGIVMYDPASGRMAYITLEWPYSLAWSLETQSPDRRYTLFVGTNESTHNRLPTVKVRDNQTSSVRQVVELDATNYDPSWSPQGDRIAFVSSFSGNDEIYTIGVDGQDLQRLTNNSWQWDKHPSWSPDGRQIIFWSNREGGRQQLFIMDADGSNQRVLIASGFNDWDPVWVK